MRRRILCGISTSLDIDTVLYTLPQNQCLNKRKIHLEFCTAQWQYYLQRPTDIAGDNMLGHVCYWTIGFTTSSYEILFNFSPAANPSVLGRPAAGETIEGTGGETIEGTGGETIEGTGGGGPAYEGYVTHPTYTIQLIIPCTVNTQVHINPGFLKLFTWKS